MSTVRQGGRYVSTAVLSALSDWGAFEILLRVVAVEAVTAQACSRLVGGLVAFGLHKGWTYGARGLSSVGGEAVRFLQLYAVSYGLSLLFLWIFHDVGGASEELGKLVADGACFAFNFVAMKRWVFGARAADFR